jgi:hypothetical protein
MIYISAHWLMALALGDAMIAASIGFVAAALFVVEGHHD